MKKSKFLVVQLIMFFRIPMGFLFALILILYEKSIIISILCLTILILGELSDLFDGFFARKFNVVTELGATLDPYCDSVFRLTIYSALACKGFIMPIVPLIMAFRDITVSYCRILLTKNQLTVSAKISGKIKAVVQACCAILSVLYPVYCKLIGNWTVQLLSWIVIIVTLLSMIEYTVSALYAVVELEKKNIALKK